MVDQHLIDVVKRLQTESKQRKFLESVELAINLRDIDLSNPRNRIQEEIVLPNGRGRSVRVGLFGGSEMAEKAKDSADVIVRPEEIEELASDRAKARKFANGADFFVAEAPLMPTIGKRLGVVLGPRGKMPKPLPPGADPTAAIEKLKGSVSARSRDRKTFHLPVGTKNMSPEKLAENIDAVLQRVMSKLERGKLNVQSAYVKTTMGPAYKVM